MSVKLLTNSLATSIKQIIEVFWKIGYPKIFLASKDYSNIGVSIQVSNLSRMDPLG